MESILLILLIMTVGVVFAWHRIKTRGLATVLEEGRRFIATQNSKDVAAYRDTRRTVTRLWDKIVNYGEKLDERHQQRGRSTQGTQQVREGQAPRERKRAQRGDWINRNASPNTPQWLKDANKAVWDGVLIYGVGSMAVVVLLILFIIGLNMS